MNERFQFPIKKKRIQYYDRVCLGYQSFGESLRLLTEKSCRPGRPLLVVCIGSDRITGDCLGPLVGHKLSRILPHPERIYGTLQSPVHAQNLCHTVRQIHAIYESPFLIAVDAALGLSSHVGCITLCDGPLRPGEGVKKRLPALGEISITGIVNSNSENNSQILQNTRLHLVEELADYIFLGILFGLSRFLL